MSAEIRNTKVLIVDNPGEVRNLRASLREIGFNSVSEMTSGLQVLTEIKKDLPAVILVNLNMPKYSGLQVFKSMKADKALAAVKFIMLAPKSNRREIKELESEGVSLILQRPFTDEELREILYKALGVNAEELAGAAQQIVLEAKAAFEKKDYQRALDYYHRATQSSQEAEYYYMQGRCYLEMGLLDQAIAAFQNTIKLNYRYEDVDHWLGVALQRKEDFVNSIKVLERAAKKENAQAQTHVELGKSHLGVNQVEQAEVAFGAAIRIKPDDVEVRAQVGNAYLEKGVYDKAEAAFGEAIKINPENIPLYNRMAIALRKQGKYKEAINLYVKALAVDPEDEGLYYNLARALSESGDKEKAIKALDKALTLDPDFEEARALRKEYSEPA